MSYITAKDLLLVQVSSQYPLQWDIWYEDKVVGYVRIAYQKITVDCPTIGGRRVYDKDIAGFDNFNSLPDEERIPTLEVAKQLVAIWCNENGITPELGDNDEI